MREGNQEAVLLALCSRTFTSKVIIFRFAARVQEVIYVHCLNFP